MPDPNMRTARAGDLVRYIPRHARSEDDVEYGLFVRWADADFQSAFVRYDLGASTKHTPTECLTLMVRHRGVVEELWLGQTDPAQVEVHRLAAENAPAWSPDPAQMQGERAVAVWVDEMPEEQR